MRLLMIASGYLPYLFSENLCNGKLVMAMMREGIEVDVISRVDEGPSYGSEWTEPWSVLKPTAYILSYPTGSKLYGVVDTLRSGLTMGKIQPGVRWMRRAYKLALKLIGENKYDALLSRSPNDTAHLVAEKVKHKTGIRWIANWNDPAGPIWPEPYKPRFSPKMQAIRMAETERLLRAADVNSFPSDSLRQHFISHFPFLKARQTAVFPHIGFVEEYWPASAEKPAEGKLRFLHSGNLSKERNPETTFHALRKIVNEGFTNFEFHIMGHVNDYTSSMIDRYGLQDYVKCIGSFPYMEALSKMQTYDVLVLLEARLDRGIFFASKFTDYLQAGKPILAISPKEGFAVDMLQDQPGEYLADNTDSESIYAALRQIVSVFEQGNLSTTASSQLFEEVAPKVVVGKYVEMLSGL